MTAKRTRRSFLKAILPTLAAVPVLGAMAPKREPCRGYNTDHMVIDDLEVERKSLERLIHILDRPIEIDREKLAKYVNETMGDIRPTGLPPFEPYD